MNQPIQGATTILAPLQILNNPDLPVADMQHIKGGGWSLADTAARDLIPAALRQKDVTRCYVEADSKIYVLRGGIANSNWVVELTTGSGVGSGKLLNRFLSTLQLIVGQAFTLDLPADLFGPAPIVYSTLDAQNLPDGVTLSAPARIAGTPTTVGPGLLLINAFLLTGEHLQYLLAYKVSDVATIVSTVGVVSLDVSFGAMSSQDPTQLVYDFDLALQLNEPGITESGQRAVPGVSTARFIGDASVVGCVAIAAVAKQTVPGNNLIRFYRFGINIARLRSLYPNQLQIRFDVRGKRKSGNPAGIGNGVYFRVGRDLTSGLISAAQPIGFASNNPTAAGAPDDYNNSGNLYGIGESETIIGQFIVTLATGITIFIPVATAPTAPAVLSIPTILPTGTQDGMLLTWNSVPNATSYETQYSAVNDAAGNSATTSGLSRTVTGLSAGTSYYARVRALGANGATSPWSGIVSVAPGGQATVLDNIATANAWILQEGFSRDGSSLDTSIWLKGLTAGQNYEVALVRQDGNAVTGQNWTSGTFGAVELATSLAYGIEPYTAVKRFNKGSGTGVTPGVYSVLVRRPELPLVVLSQSVTFGESTSGVVLIAQYQPPAQSGGGGGTAVTTITASTGTPPWLTYLGWNRDVSGGSSDGETNVFWDSTEPLKARILENGAAVANASWANPAQFMTKYTGDNYVPGGHSERIRLVAGILEGHTYSIELCRVSTAADPFTILYTPVREAGIHPITLPSGATTTGGGSTGTGSSTTDYTGGTSDTLTGLTDPDGQAADITTLDPNAEN